MFDRRVLIPRLRGMQGVILDADDVVTTGATVHGAAWKRAFDAFLKEISVPSPAQLRPFDPAEDYWRYLAGRSGHEGAAAYLDARGIVLPPGTLADPPGWWSVRALEAFKDRVFADYSRRYRVLAQPAVMRVVRELRHCGLPLAAASPTRSTRELLAGAGVLDFFDEVTDGRWLDADAFRGPPDPALMIHAVGRLTGDRAHTVAVLGSLAGVRAAHRAGLGLVVALDHHRSLQSELELSRAGAHLVLRDMRELLVRTSAERTGPRIA